jgi:hypothetical protein
MTTIPRLDATEGEKCRSSIGLAIPPVHAAMSQTTGPLAKMYGKYTSLYMPHGEQIPTKYRPPIADTAKLYATRNEILIVPAFILFSLVAET